MDVAEELTDFGDQIDRAHIERRIDDWESRIDAIYRQIDEWLPAGWASRQKVDVAMSEPLMRSFAVADHRLPSLLLVNGNRSVRLESRGLWIIGANGRIDMVSLEAHHILIDQAELYEEPRWTISAFLDQLHPKLLTRDRFVASLG